MWDNIQEMFPNDLLPALAQEYQLPYSTLDEVIRENPPMINIRKEYIPNGQYCYAETYTWYSDGNFIRKIEDSVYPTVGVDGISALNVFGLKMKNQCLKKQMVFQPRYDIENNNKRSNYF